MRNLSDYCVLVVDDVQLNLLLVSKMLSQFNFRIRLAGGGAEALEMVAADKPDIILLDILMPEIDGYEVLTRLKADPSLKDIPVIVLSALNTNEAIVRAYNLGAVDFITKPVLLEKLVNSVDQQIRMISESREKDFENK